MKSQKLQINMDVFILKIILIAIMFLTSTFFGLLPIKLLQYLRKRAAGIMQHKWPSLVLCLLSCFTGGVFLGTCFLHLMPDV
uniref:Uncharacterized protein n=1 Tax=Romanomermis culicivorax TaxID=13658 RepID=A0A915ITQ3_ROMCU